MPRTRLTSGFGAFNYVYMYTCSTCNAQVKTRQGLAGHHRFRHEGKGYPSNYRPPPKDPTDQPATSGQLVELQETVAELVRLVGAIGVRLDGVEEQVSKVRQQDMTIEGHLRAMQLAMQPIAERLDRTEDEVGQIKQRGQSTEETLDQLLQVEAAATVAQEEQRRAAKEAETAEKEAETAEAWAKLWAEMAEKEAGTAEAWAKLWAEMAKLREGAESFLDAMRRRADERGEMAALQEGLEMYLAVLREQSTVVSSPNVDGDNEPRHDILRLRTPLHEPDP